MTHLTDLELVDGIDDGLPLERRRHLDTCAPCRSRLADLQTTLAQAADADVPEPSPLFWDHLSARVRKGVASSEGHPLSGLWLGWLRHNGLAWAVSGALVVALIVGAAWGVSAPSGSHTVDRSSPAQVATATDAEPADTDVDPAWAVVRTVADEVQWNDAVVAGIAAQPDAAERAATSLSAAERSELVRLLLAEAKRPGA